jgi:hypothetical protein
MKNEELEELFCELDNLHNLAMWQEWGKDLSEACTCNMDWFV